MSLERQTNDGITNKEQDEFGYSYEWLFRPNWYATGQLDFMRDPQRELDSRWTIGAGIGHDVWDRADKELKFALLANVISEKIGGVKEESGAPHWQFRFRYPLLSSDMEFFHNHDFMYFIAGRDTEIFRSSTGIRWDITDDFYANFQYDWNHETNPAPGNKKTDTTFVVGVGIEFD